MSKDSLTITDNRTGRTYEVPVQNGTIKAIDLRQIKVEDGDFGLMTYDPAFTNTAACKSRITFIDGEKGILNYRGYPIEQLAERSNYLETAYLIVHGELPSQGQYGSWLHNITHHTMVHENIKELMGAFRYDAHPMGMLASTVAALSTFYPEAKAVREKQVALDLFLTMRAGRRRRPHQSLRFRFRSIRKSAGKSSGTSMSAIAEPRPRLPAWMPIW